MNCIFQLLLFFNMFIKSAKKDSPPGSGGVPKFMQTNLVSLKISSSHEFGGGGGN
jgi:hypothetical protein